MGERVCLRCGGPMAGKRSHARFCSVACQKRQWASANPDIRSRASRYRKNAEAAKAYQRRWYASMTEERRDRKRENGRAWEANNIEKVRCKGRRMWRTRAAAQHMQDALAAIPEIMALAAQLEKTNDK